MRFELDQLQPQYGLYPLHTLKEGAVRSRFALPKVHAPWPVPPLLTGSQTSAHLLRRAIGVAVTRTHRLHPIETLQACNLERGHTYPSGA